MTEYTHQPPTGSTSTLSPLQPDLWASTVRILLRHGTDISHSLLHPHAQAGSAAAGLRDHLTKPNGSQDTMNGSSQPRGPTVIRLSPTGHFPPHSWAYGQFRRLAWKPSAPIPLDELYNHSKPAPCLPGWGCRGDHRGYSGG